MILKQTILSAFNERGTLLKWLKKVEKALNESVLVSVDVEQISATEAKIVLTFESGDTLETPVFELPKGETGAAGTITIGNVTTGAPSEPASVVNVGTPQNALLNFVIPRGETGATGEAVGIDNVNDSNIDTRNGSVGVANTDITFYEALLRLYLAPENVGDLPEELVIPLTMFLALRGSDSIVIDATEDNKAAEIHLDASITSKLARALLTPVSAPSSTSLVAVDTANAQGFLTLGNGLQISNGALAVITYDGSVT